MTDEFLIFGAVVSVVGLIGGVIVRDRYVMKTITDGEKELHARINKVRDDFVRKDDLDGHLTRIDSNIKELKSGLKENGTEMNRRLDKIIAAVSK